MSKIAENSSVTIGLLITIVTITVGVVLWINSSLNSLGDEINSLNQKVSILQEDNKRKWSKNDMGTWALIFKNRNPNIYVPGTSVNVLPFESRAMKFSFKADEFKKEADKNEQSN